MSGISADDANFLLACKKVFGHYVSSIAACAHDDVHRVSSLPALDAQGCGLDSADSTNFRVAQQRGHRAAQRNFLLIHPEDSVGVPANSSQSAQLRHFEIA